MKIAILVEQDKQDELVEKFLNKWPNYKFDSDSAYKSFANNDLEKDLYEEMEFRREEMLSNNKNQHQLYITSPLKTLAKILLEVELGNLSDTDFVTDSILVTRNTIKMYDVVFWVKSESDPLKPFYESMNMDYWNRSHVIFPEKDIPAFIEISGGTVDNIINQVAEFVNEHGESYEPDSNFWTKEIEALKNLKL